VVTPCGAKKIVSDCRQRERPCLVSRPHRSCLRAIPRTVQGNKGTQEKLAAWARWRSREVRLDAAHPMTEPDHPRQHLRILRLPSPCPLDRNDLPKQSRRFIIELDPVLDAPQSCVRPGSIPACRPCHDVSLSCAQSSVAREAGALRRGPCTSSARPRHPSDEENSARSPSTYHALSINSVAKQRQPI
jgi:hypothetical protein